MDYHSFSCRDSFDVPPLISKIIDDVILSSGEEIEKWEQNYKQAAFRAEPYTYTCNRKLIETFIKSLDNIALKADGTMNFLGCVENVLTSIKKSDPIQKFKFACLFCLEKHVRELWPLVLERLSTIDSELLTSPHIDPWILYWRNILNNDVNEESFVRGLLAASVTARNWIAFEYFWDKLTEESQTQEAAAIIQKLDLYSIRCVLFKLNEKQVREICAQNGDYIFKGLLETHHHEYYEYATKFWHFMKNSICAQVFSNIVKVLWNVVFNPSGYHFTRIRQNSQLLHEIWLSAPNSVKSSSAFVKKLFATLDSDVRGVHHYDLTFIFELLKNTGYSCRVNEKLWRVHWSKLMIRAKPSDLEQLMELCFPKKHEIQPFKENIEKSLNESLRFYFRGCVNKALYSELYDCLNFFTKNPSRLEYLSREIITRNLDLIISYNEDKLAKCQSFINSTFCNEQDAEKFLEEIIVNPKCLPLLCGKLADGCFDDVISLYSRFPTSGQRLQEMKQGIMANCYRDVFARGQIDAFDEKKFNEFTSWCSLEEDKISEFKRSLIIDNIFLIVLNDIVQEYCDAPYESRRTHVDQYLQSYELRLTYFDQFLQWYFGSSEEAKQYKSNKLFNYKQWPEINIYVWERCIPEFVDMLLLWAFEKNEEKMSDVTLSLGMDHFKLKYSDSFY